MRLRAVDRDLLAQLGDPPKVHGSATAQPRSARPHQPGVHLRRDACFVSHRTNVSDQLFEAKGRKESCSSQDEVKSEEDLDEKDCLSFFILLLASQDIEAEAEAGP